MSQQRAWFPSPETEDVEQTLALAQADTHLIEFRQMMTEQFPIPEVLLVAQVTGGTTEISGDAFGVFRFQRRGTPRAFLVAQPGQAAILEASDPPGHAARALSEDLGGLVATVSFTNQKQSMESVVVAGFLRTKNFLLNRQFDNVSIVDGQGSHALFPPATMVERNDAMRNYL
jgi:hypothetical protein